MLNIRRIRTAYNHSLKQFSRLFLCISVIDISIILSKLWWSLVVSWPWFHRCSFCSFIKTCRSCSKVEFSVCTSTMRREKVFSHVWKVRRILIIARPRNLIIYVKQLITRVQETLWFRVRIAYAGKTASVKGLWNLWVILVIRWTRIFILWLYAHCFIDNYRFWTHRVNWSFHSSRSVFVLNTVTGNTRML